MAPVFCKAKNDYIGQETGEKYETEVVGNGSKYCFVSTDEFMFVWSFKNGNRRQNRRGLSYTVKGEKIPVCFYVTVFL